MEKRLRRASPLNLLSKGEEAIVKDNAEKEGIKKVLFPSENR
jgi:hypothetical protein